MHGRMAEGDEVIDLDDEATATDAVGEAPQPGDPEAAEEGSYRHHCGRSR